MADRTIQDLRMKQALDLPVKLLLTKSRIREWVNEFGEEGVYVSFSGGKDSTVLLHIVREVMGYKNIPAVFVDTGLEYPEIREFVKTFDNVTWVKPKLTFKQVIEKCGYPVISKEVSKNVYYAKRSVEKGDFSNIHYKKLTGKYIDKDGKKSMFCSEKYEFLLKSPFLIGDGCCSNMKKSPAHKYGKDTGRYAITGQTAEESQLRTQQWLMNGCNGFNMARPISNPMSFWTEQDILRYIRENNIPICSVYGEVAPDMPEECEGQISVEDLGLIPDNRKLKTTGCKRTGCMFCLYGIQLEKNPNRLELMKKTHPKLYDYIMRDKEKGGLGYKKLIDWLNENGNLNIKY